MKDNLPQLSDITGVQSLFSNYFTKEQVITTTALVNYYNRETTDSYIDAKIDTADVDNIIYTSNNKNYITATNITNDIRQLVIEADGVPLVDVDEGALTSYVNVVGPNLRKLYTFNTHGSAQWILLGVLHTTQTGQHLKFEFTHCSNYNASSDCSNFSTIQF